MQKIADNEIKRAANARDRLKDLASTTEEN
jgi:hypothetical protein